MYIQVTLTRRTPDSTRRRASRKLSPILVAAVAVADAGRFQLEVEGAAGGRRGHHAKGLLVEAAQAVRGSRTLKMAVGVVEGRQQAAAGDDAGGVEVRGRREGVQRRLGELGTAVNSKGSSRPQKAGVGAGVRDAVVADGPWDRHAARQAPRRAEMSQDRPEKGELPPRAEVLRDRQLHVVAAGQHVVDGRLVVVAAVRERADDAHPVHDAGRARQVLADVEAGDVGADRRKERANALGGAGFQIPQVHLGRTAPQEKVDARLRPGGPRGGVGAGGLEELGQGESTRPSWPRRIMASRRWSMRKALQAGTTANLSRRPAARKRNPLPPLLLLFIFRVQNGI